MTGMLIGLGGRLAAGKDAVADHLVDAYGFIKLGMSDVLLECALEMDPFIPINAHEREHRVGTHGQFVRMSWLVAEVGYVEAKKNPEVRRFLQKLGTDVGRYKIGENVWVDMLAKRIAELRATGADVVLTGVRYPNESAMVTELNGLSIWVSRPGHEPSGDAALHTSENSVDDSDFALAIVNGGTLDDLYRKVDEVVRRTLTAGHPPIGYIPC